MARRKACSVCRREGHDRRAHASDGGRLGQRVVALGAVTLTVDVRGDLLSLTAGQRAFLFAVIDLVNGADREVDHA